jgi:hypothetical protein
MAVAIELPWGPGRLPIRLPASWHLLGEFQPAAVPAVGDVYQACRDALQQPMEAAPLGGRNLAGKRILIVSDDISRPTPVSRFFSPVRDALLASGARDEDIEILFALGVHRPMTQAEAESKVGVENLARHRWHNHDAFQRDGLVHLGRTAAGTPVWLNRLLTRFDLLVTLGAIEPHLLLGFSGGYKMLVPGCAGAETIGHNHMQGASHLRYNYVGADADDSPMRLDLEDAAARVGREVFVVNAALNERVEVACFFCGSPIAAQRAGAAFVRQYSEVPLPEAADVVITNSAPFDADLRQGMKCVGNTCLAARPGGVILGFLRCNQGRGDVPLPPVAIPYAVNRRLMRAIGPKRIMGFVNVVKRFDPIEQKFLAHFGLQMLHGNDIFIYSENLPAGTGRKLGILRQYQSTEAILADALQRVGREATVAVFPKGGATYSRGPLAEPVCA